MPTLPRLSCLALLTALTLTACKPATDDASNTSEPAATAPPPVAPVGAPEPTPTPGTGQASPWNEARARGIGFRAVGNEPGWFVEVGMGEVPPLHATLDYGEQTLDVAQTASLDDALGFQGKTGDGTDVVLRIKRETCIDGMSGEEFEASARLTVAGKAYDGCGAFLFD